jgi:single-strand DNA-binding protein
MVSLATSDRRKVDGEWKEFTDWHSLVFFGRTAGIARDYLLKGSKILVEGKLHTYSYTDDSNTTRWRTDVQVHDLTLISGTRQSSDQQHSAPRNADGTETSDDIPF